MGPRLLRLQLLTRSSRLRRWYDPRGTDCVGAAKTPQHAKAPRKEGVLNALSQIASRYRTRVVVSLSTVNSHHTHRAEATMPSFVALKA